MIVTQGVSDMQPSLLILGGTSEAAALAEAVRAAGLSGVFSFAGRVARPKPVALPRRVGGFGGVEGLVAYLTAQKITHVIDATHPFAAQMSRNAIEACRLTGTPLIALTRPPWQVEPGDKWQRVPDIPGAVAALAGPARRVMLAVGRMHLAEFTPNPQHFYLLRLVDPPEGTPPFPRHHVLISRGPFRLEGDRALMLEHQIDLVVSKNSGGSAAYAKIAAARDLGLPVLMIDRPALSARAEVGSVAEVLNWVVHPGTERGV